MTGEGLLGPYRVLDLTDDRGWVCGRILADLGADVIKVEPPGGDPGRRRGPFYQDVPHPERSLYFWAFNLNKRGITLNLETADGRELFRRLVARSDFVIESFQPGYLASLGLDFRELSRLNPRVILVSISAFGQDGPYAGYRATDIVGMAMGGMMAISGDPDRPPVRISVPQAWLHAGAQAAAGAMVAHYYRELTGRGQHVDVSMQQAVIWTLMNETPFPLPDFYGFDLRRAGGRRTTGRLVIRQIYPCRDGYICLLILGGQAGAKSMRGLMTLLEEAGLLPNWLRDFEWETWDMATPRHHPTAQAELEAIERLLAELFRQRTKSELYEAALKHGILLAPVNTVTDLFNNPQLAARGFWVEVDHPELGTKVTYPGPFIQGTLNPARIYRRPPLIGEHNEEIYCGLLGLTRSDLERLRGANAI